MQNMEYALNSDALVVRGMFKRSSSCRVILAHIEPYTVDCLLLRWLYSESMPIVCASLDTPLRLRAGVTRLLEAGWMYEH